MAIYVPYEVETRIAIFPSDQLSSPFLLNSFIVQFKDWFSNIFFPYVFKLAQILRYPNFATPASNSFWTAVLTSSTVALHGTNGLLCKPRALNLLFNVHRLIWCPWYTFKNSKISVYVNPA